MGGFRFAAAVAAALSAFAVRMAPVYAQTPAPSDDIVTYMGADRQDRLIEGAKKEGGFTLYSSATTEDMGEIIKGFEAKYGLKVKFWRGDSEGILRRAVVEARGGRDEFDLIETSGRTMEALYREKLLQPVASPVLADISPKGRYPHDSWTATRFQIQTLAYNTNAVRKENLPKSWEDLTDPNWKGKLGIEIDNHEWFGALVEALGEEKGLKIMREIGARNGVSIRKGHTLLANLTASGEVPLALGIYHYRVAQLKRQGAPIELLDLPPVIVHPIGVGLSRKPHHPYSALLFFDYILTDAQKIYLGQDTQPTNIKVKTEPEAAVYMNFGEALDQNDKWQKIFRETFPGKAR
jgi:iron(III) transport system substrate-binding protein